MSNPIQYDPIGVIRTPFDDPEGMPIQPAGESTDGWVENARADVETTAADDRFGE